MAKRVSRREAVTVAAAAATTLISVAAVNAEDKKDADEEKSKEKNHNHLDVDENQTILDLTAKAREPDQIEAMFGKKLRKVIIYVADGDYCYPNCGCNGFWYGYICRRCGKVCACRGRRKSKAKSDHHDHGR